MSKAKIESPKKSVQSEATPRSNRRATAVPRVGSAPSPQTDAKLATWLDTQARKLKGLEKKGHILKIDFVLNASQKGKILLKVQKRLSKIPKEFERWVKECAGIGYSTALLYIDVADNFGDVSEHFCNSNSLECTLRQVRDAIRDARHERGEGKPSSGRRKTSPTATQPDGDGQTGDSPDDAEASDETTQPKQPFCQVTVMVANEGDQTNIQNALSRWSPTSTMPIGTKQVRSVTAYVRPDDIGTALGLLGKALEANPPKAIKNQAMDLTVTANEKATPAKENDTLMARLFKMVRLIEYQARDFERIDWTKESPENCRNSIDQAMQVLQGIREKLPEEKRRA